jgi:hypothetical protein
VNALGEQSRFWPRVLSCVRCVCVSICVCIGVCMCVYVYVSVCELLLQLYVLVCVRASG